MECATLLPRKDDSMIGKKNPSSNVSLKNVAYGLGIVALACSGSFVAGRSAAQYKLSAGTSQLGVARLGSKASSVKHSTAHSAAAAKKAKTSLANVGEDEDDQSVFRRRNHTTGGSRHHVQRGNGRGNQTTERVHDLLSRRRRSRGIKRFVFLFPLLGDLFGLECASSRPRGIEGRGTFLFDDDSSSIIYSFRLLLSTHANRFLFSLFF